MIPAPRLPIILKPTSLKFPSIHHEYALASEPYRSSTQTVNIEPSDWTSGDLTRSHFMFLQSPVPQRQNYRDHE
jgi:hypothetical protein